MAKKKTTAKQTSLFDPTPTEEELRNAVILKQPDPGRLRKMTNELSYTYNKDEIYSLGQMFYPMLKGKLVLAEQPDGTRTVCRDLGPLFSMDSFKDQMVRALAFILAEPANLASYVATLSGNMRQLWRKLLLHFYVSHQTAQEIMGTTSALYKESRYYYAPKGWNQQGFDFFKVSSSLRADIGDYGWRDSAFYILMPSLTQALFFHLFFPEIDQADPTVAELPEGHTVFNMEEESYAKYALLSSLIRTGKVAMLQKGISQADVKRVAKQLGMVEFFAGGPVPMPALRSRFYIELIVLEDFLHGKRRKAVAYHEVMRCLMDSPKDLRPYLTPLMLPHIKGLRKQMTDHNALADLCQTMLSWLKEEPDRWTAIEGFALKFYAANAGDDDLRRQMMVFNIYDQSERAEIINSYTGQTIACDSFVTEFGYTALQAAAFMLCSLGMAELALAGESQPTSPFSRAAYIRLTPLGRYALRLDREYEPPRQEQVACFELDPDRLIIRSLVTPNPYAQLLLDTSTAISRNRYETSAQSFLAHCQKRTDVEEKIAIFQQFVSSELPPLWKQFFDSLLKHCNPLTAVKTGYHIYQISPDNADLIRLVTTDERLRTIVTRAEGYLLLVRKDDQKRFVEELKKHGYLL